MNKKILILSGDPNSINSEIIFKSWSRIKGSLKKKIYFISNYNLLNRQAKKINMSSKMVKTKGIYDLENDKRIKVIDLNLEFNNPFKVSKKDASKFIRSSLNLAHKLAKDKNVKVHLPHDVVVSEKFSNGQISDIRNYCETDVLNTWLVYLKFELMRGNLDRIEFEEELNITLEFLKSLNVSHFDEFQAALE